MQKIIHRAEERGRGDYGWLTTRYSFSFANWYEPNRMGFGQLRVINDDTIAPASGFPMHAHKDMEIITIVTKGTLTHKDSLGNTGTINAGDVQVMNAGTGVVHSEYNASASEPLELFQIWIQPEKRSTAPVYVQKKFKNGEVDLRVGEDSHITQVHLNVAESFGYRVKKEGNGVYVFVVEGSVEIADEHLGARDAAGFSEIENIEIETSTGATLLLIEVPMR